MNDSNFALSPGQLPRRIQGPMPIHSANKALLRQFSALFIRTTGCATYISPSRSVRIPFHCRPTKTSASLPWSWHHHFSSSAHQQQIKAEPLSSTVNRLRSSWQSWTEAEDQIIKKSLTRERDGHAWAASQLPHRTLSAVKGRRTQFKEEKISRKRWTEQEDLILQESFNIPHGLKLALSQLPSRSYHAVRRRRQTHLQYPLHKEGKTWLPEEVETLSSLIRQNVRPYEVRSHFPGRSFGSLMVQHGKLKTEMGLQEKKAKKNTYSPKRQRRWTQEEDDQIRQELSRPDNAELSCDQVLNRLMFSPTWDRYEDTTRKRIMKIMDGRYNPSSTLPWTSVDESRVMAAVADYVGPRYRPQLSYLGQDFVNSERSFDPQRIAGKIISYDDDKPYLSPNSPELDRIDWQDVARKVQTKPPGSCRYQFYNRLSLRARKRWSAEENDRLLKALAKHGPDAVTLSKLVETRGPRQCLQRLWNMDHRNELKQN